MPLRIEDYALIGDTQTAALVGNNGRIDWACFPRFDSDACFAALLGDERHGSWLLAPRGEIRSVKRRYLPGTLILETEFTTEDGVAQVLDFMPIRGETPDIVRLVVGVSGRVRFQLDLRVRYHYGSVQPYVRKDEHGTVYITGPDALYLRTPLPVKDGRAEFTVEPKDRVPLVLSWNQSFHPAPRPLNADKALEQTRRWWEKWSGACIYDGEWKEEVLRSLIVLKALHYGPAGGLLAAPTTSLPEALGGKRNWDYRYCWLRDSTFSLYAFLFGGYRSEAAAWRDWLVRAVGGDASQVHPFFGPAGEHGGQAHEAGWLPGYQGAKPVQIGNGAVHQLQLDAFGELMDTLHQAHMEGLGPEKAVLELEGGLLEYLERNWERPDKSIWEMKGEPRQFTYSKVMCWAAMDRGVKAAKAYGLEGPVERWRQLRDRIHADVCENGYDASRNTFVQSYGAQALDAALLLLPLVGFLPAHDPRVQGTVRAIEQHLMDDGLVRRYGPDAHDHLPGHEGAFLACSFWLVDYYIMAGRMEDARTLFMRALSVANDVGLLSEEYDTQAQRLVGNFPQALSHVAMVHAAYNLATNGWLIHRRAGDQRAQSKRSPLQRPEHRP